MTVNSRKISFEKKGPNDTSLEAVLALSAHGESANAEISFKIDGLIEGSGEPKVLSLADAKRFIEEMILLVKQGEKFMAEYGDKK